MSPLPRQLPPRPGKVRRLHRHHKASRIHHFIEEFKMATYGVSAHVLLGFCCIGANMLSGVHGGGKLDIPEAFIAAPLTGDIDALA